MNKDILSQWCKDKGDQTHRLNYNLDPQSIVFDLGGHTGTWTEAIYKKFQCNIFVFEPVPQFAAKIREKFKENQAIKLFEFGLSNENKKVSLAVNGVASSMYHQKGKKIKIKLKKAKDFLKQYNIQRIDLMKINIEGGEYELLEHLIETECIHKIGNVQVQFHDVIPNAEKRMKSIQNQLKKTHYLTYQYPFVWENWAKIDA